MDQEIKSHVLELIEYQNFSKCDKLKHCGEIFKYRVGKYRVFLKIEKNFVLFIDIKHRSKAYERKYLNKLKKY